MVPALKDKANKCVPVCLPRPAMTEAPATEVRSNSDLALLMEKIRRSIVTVPRSESNTIVVREVNKHRPMRRKGTAVKLAAQSRALNECAWRKTSKIAIPSSENRIMVMPAAKYGGSITMRRSLDCCTTRISEEGNTLDRNFPVRPFRLGIRPAAEILKYLAQGQARG